jgi:hypothetical protein
MARIQLRDLVGARCGDKGNISDITLFADDEAAYAALLGVLTVDVVRAHLGSLVEGSVERFEAPNVWGIKFVCQDALGGGAPRSLRSDNLGKTMSGALLRLWVDVPDEVAANARRTQRAPLPR